MLPDSITITLNSFRWQDPLLILLFFLVAWVIYRLSSRLAGRLIRLGKLSREEERPSDERLQTLHGLYANVITFIAFGLAVVLSLSLFVPSSTLLWVIGLFSAGFGLGARPIVSDFLTGIGFIFEDSFDLGEKVAFRGLPGGSIEGVVEAVNLRTTVIRAATGEPLTVPNGEIRVIRNYSRGRYSTANVSIKIHAADLDRALPLLETLAAEAVELLPNLLEPWLVISETGVIGEQTELTLLAKARFGNAAEMRPRLLLLVHERLEEAGIALAG